MLDESNHEHHTFKLPEENTLTAVLWDVSQIIWTNEVKHNLMDVKFDVIALSRMHRKTEKVKIGMPLILVQLSNTTQN